MRRAEQKLAEKIRIGGTGSPKKRLDVKKMTKVNNQAKHMNQNAYGNGKSKRKAGIVALALAGVLAIGGVGAVCIAGVGKSPGQAPVATQTGTAQKTSTKRASKPATQQQSKPAVQQASQQQANKPAAQPAQQQSKPAAQPVKQATQQQSQPQAEKSNSGLEAKLSREECIAIACKYVGAGGAAKGEAMNVTAKGPITGGGTVYYVVELDLGDVHYSVNVDAIDGHTYGADQTHAGTRTLLDDQGNPVEGTEWPAEA